MSVVVVKKYKGKIVIGADSIRINGVGTQEKDKNAKLYEISKELALGFSGDCSVGGLFREFLMNHLPKTNNEYGYTNLMAEFFAHMNSLAPGFKLDDTDFIIVYKRKIFLICNFFIREIKDHYAIGAGADYALATLYLGHDVRKAISVACHLSIFCEKPINIIEIK